MIAISDSYRSQFPRRYAPFYDSPLAEDQSTSAHAVADEICSDVHPGTGVTGVA